MPRPAVCVLVVLSLGLLGVGSAAAQTRPEAGTPFDGRWVIAGDPWFSEISTGRAGRGGAQAPDPEVILELTVAPGGTVTGLATGVSGRRGAPGSHPAHRVEITRGRLAVDTLQLEIWRFDGYHNRVHVEARVEGDALALEFRRETPDGPVTFTTRARRAGY